MSQREEENKKESEEEMTYLIFFSGLLLGFVASNFLSLWMMTRRNKKTDVFEKRLYNYHEERNKIMNDITMYLEDISSQMRKNGI